MDEKSLLALLEAWRGREIDISLYGDSKGWHLQLSTRYPGQGEPPHAVGKLQYTSPHYEQPDAAIRAILEAVKP